MRRFLTWLACAAGAAWILGRLRRRPPEPAVDPAEDLRRKLDESRAASPEPGPEPEPEPEQQAAPEEPEPAPGLEERRRVVHVRARASIDEMRGRMTPPE